MKKENIKFEYSAGGIVVNNYNVLVIKTKNLKNEIVYTFPKGHIEQGETAQQAAVREVEEETGVKAEIIEKIMDVEYWFIKDKQKIHKTVSWFLMRPISMNVFRNIEVDEVFWYDINKVTELLSYDSDKKLISKVLSILKGI